MVTCSWSVPVPEDASKGRGLCQPCTDAWWRYTGWRLRDNPLPLDPPMLVQPCAQCDQGWMGRILRAEGCHASPGTVAEPCRDCRGTGTAEIDWDDIAGEPIEGVCPACGGTGARPEPVAAA